MIIRFHNILSSFDFSGFQFNKRNCCLQQDCFFYFSRQSYYAQRIQFQFNAQEQVYLFLPQVDLDSIGAASLDIYKKVEWYYISYFIAYKFIVLRHSYFDLQFRLPAFSFLNYEEVSLAFCLNSILRKDFSNKKVPIKKLQGFEREIPLKYKQISISKKICS